MNALGVDACPQGWVGVRTDGGAFHSAVVRRRFADLVDAEGLGAIGVDIPIGLPKEPGRTADLDARNFLGRRRSAVFLTYPRETLLATSYEDAKQICEQRGWPKLSLQSFGMRKRIFEVEAFLATTEIPTVEVHPEVSFHVMAGLVGLHPPRYSKSTWGGWLERRSLLDQIGMSLPEDLGQAPLIDTLDAAAAAWSAHRYARDECVRFPEASPERRLTIWA